MPQRLRRHQHLQQIRSVLLVDLNVEIATVNLFLLVTRTQKIKSFLQKKKSGGEKVKILMIGIGGKNL